MNRKILIIVGVGLVAATVSTLFFYSIIVDSFGLDEAEKKASVVVALRDLPRGYHLSAHDLEVAQLPADEAPHGAFASIGEIDGQITKLQVKKGDTIVPDLLISEGLRGISSVIPIGMRAVSVHVEEYAGVTELVEMGDRVDVLVADSSRKPGDRFMSIRTLLQNVEVLTTGREGTGKAIRGNVVPVVTLLVESKQSEALSIADHAGSIRLALRHPDDEGSDVPQGASLNDIVALGGSKLGRPRTSRAPSPPVRTPAAGRPNPITPSTATTVEPKVSSSKTEGNARPAQSGGQVLLAVRFAALKPAALNVLQSALDQNISAKTFSVSTFRPGWSPGESLEPLVAAHELEVFAEPNLLAIDDTSVYFEKASKLVDGQDPSAPPATDLGPVGLKVSLHPTIKKDGRLQVTISSEVVVSLDADDGQPLELTRRSECVVALENGQSFWVRGLLQPSESAAFLKRLFPAKYDANDEPLELAVLVTPSLADNSGSPIPLSADD
jgi:pilus assembly protein CpaB